METTPSKPDYSGNRLTLKDIGVSKEELEALKPPAPVVDMAAYRSKETAAKIDKRRSTQERNRNLKAAALVGVVLLGSAKLTYEAFKEKIHPAHRVVALNELDSGTNVELDDVKPGTQLEVSPLSYTITGGSRVREDSNTEANLVSADLSGKVLVRPIEVPDDSNPANGNWYVFYDANGQKFAINEQNVTGIADPNLASASDIEVTVDKTTNMGIIAHDKNNVSMQVATVVDTNS